MIDEYILLMFKKLFLVIFFSLNTFSEDLDLECKGTIGWVIEQDFGEIVMSLNLNLLEKTGHILLPPQLIPFQVRNKGNKFEFDKVDVKDEEIVTSFVLVNSGLIKSISTISLSRVTGRIDYQNKYRQKGFSGECTKVEKKIKF
jgi:hypothetical protein